MLEPTNRITTDTLYFASIEYLWNNRVHLVGDPRALNYVVLSFTVDNDNHFHVLNKLSYSAYDLPAPH